MRQKLGQHFLHNQKAIELLVSSLDVQPGDIVLEIGPGLGALTAPLTKECLEKNARLVAVEKDPSLVEKLRGESSGSLEVILGDIRKLLAPVAASFEKSSYKIIGNIPYYLTGRLFTLISALPHKPSRIILTVQEEVADRILAVPPRMNRLAAAIQIWASPEVLLRLSPEDFSPPPEVRSAVLLLKTKDDAPSGKALREYYAFMRGVFAQPRKTIENNVSSFAKLPRDLVRAILRKSSVDFSARPQSLSVESICLAAEAFVNVRSKSYNKEK
ncbi:MAG: 16S rRNA (adenine(1518)-N(6)/adenine(1519)-N(6))-dimethyltransferase RsmA [Patescibacteria group bacterium]